MGENINIPHMQGMSSQGMKLLRELIHSFRRPRNNGKAIEDLNGNMVVNSIKLHSTKQMKIPQKDRLDSQCHFGNRSAMINNYQSCLQYLSNCPSDMF